MVDFLTSIDLWDAMQEHCSKCGSYKTTTVYHKDSYGWSHVCNTYAHNKKDGEHLHVTCQNCHYDWTKPVLDAQ